MSGLATWLPRQWEHIGWWALLMWPVQAVLRVLVSLRRRLYSAGWLRSERLPVPVVVVGNRIAGGAGKTPTTLAVLAHLRQRGRTPGLISRGHARARDDRTVVLDAQSAPGLDAQQVGDEPWLMWQRSAVPVAVSRRRADAGRQLLAAHPEIDVIVADDGLQHLALARDVEVVVFDERGCGNGLLLPAGPLREPAGVGPGPGCTQAPIVVRTHAGPVDAEPSDLPTHHRARRVLAAPQPFDAWRRGVPAGPGALPDPLRSLPEGDCVAVAGIAVPERFFQVLRDWGLTFTPCPLADHADFTHLPWPAGTPHVIMTEKDAVKLDPARLARDCPGTTIWVVPMSLDIEPAFWRALDAALTSPA